MLCVSMRGRDRDQHWTDKKKESVEVRVCCVPGDDLATDIGSPVDSTIALWLKSSVHFSEEMQELQNL